MRVYKLYVYFSVSMIMIILLQCLMLRNLVMSLAFSSLHYVLNMEDKKFVRGLLTSSLAVPLPRRALTPVHLAQPRSHSEFGLGT